LSPFRVTGRKNCRGGVGLPGVVGINLGLIAERERILLFLKKKKQKDFCFLRAREAMGV
jgi:hypothetical protein